MYGGFLVTTVLWCFGSFVIQSVQGDTERQDTFKKGASLPSWSR
jgi:hypothetical protein